MNNFVKKIGVFSFVLGLLIMFFSLLYGVRTKQSLSFRVLGEEISESELDVKETVVIPTPFSLKNFDPDHLLTSTEKSFVLLVFSRLISVNSEMQVEADLLSKWNYNLDDNFYEFEINNAITFHDGKKLTVEDILFSFHIWADKNYLDNNLLSSIKGYRSFQEKFTSSISGIKKINDRTFRIYLKNRSDDFVRNLASPRFVVFPENFNGNNRDQFFESPIGTGPFKLLKNDEKGAVFEASLSYHLGVPKTHFIEFIKTKDKLAVQGFIDGKFSNLVMYNFYSLEKINPALKRKNSKYFVAPANKTLVAVLGGQNAAIGENQKRKYLVSVFDKENLRNNCFPDSMVASSVIPSGVLGHSKHEETATNLYDIETIKRSRSNGHETLYIPDYQGEGGCLYSYFLDKFKNTDNNVLLASFDKMFSMLKNNQLGFWIEDLEFKSEDPMSILQYFSQESPEYFLGGKHPTLQKYFSELSNVGENQRVKIYREIDEYLIRNNLVVPLVFLNRYLVFDEEFKGYEKLSGTRYANGWHEIYERQK